MIKKLLELSLGLFGLFLFPKVLSAAPVSYVQIATATRTQSGGFHTSTGTVDTFHVGYGTLAAPSFSVGISSMGILATNDSTLSLIVNKGWTNGGTQINLDTGGARVFADGSTNPLFVLGSTNNDMEIGINNTSNGTSAVAVVQAQAGANEAALTMAAFGPQYGLPGGTRCGLVSNNLAVLESGGTSLNGMVIETRLNVPIVFGINDVRTMILSTGSLNAQFEGGVNASSFTATYGVVGATGTFSGLVTISSESVTTTLTASTVNVTGRFAGRGTSTNDNAAAGWIGEYVSSTTATNTPSTGNNQYFDLGAVVLSPGDWDLSGVCMFDPNASESYIECGIGTASGNSGSGLTNGDTNLQSLPVSAGIAQSLTLPGVRKSIASSTTYYLKAHIGYSGTTPTATGRLSARRVR